MTEERKFTPRGFEDYCKFIDTNGSEVVVRASSIATDVCVWIFANNNPHMPNASPHLNVEQAKIVAAALLQFVALAEVETISDERVLEIIKASELAPYDPNPLESAAAYRDVAILLQELLERRKA